LGFAAYVAPRLPASLPASILNLIRSLVSDAVSGVTQPILVQSVILILIGGIMLIAAYQQKNSVRRT
ncbi:MAG TPA: hypothetical protein PKC99_15725, partial [Anaerolineales bacterium]|nr:hypothetical protein [Anaerolineales bacterium]